MNKAEERAEEYCNSTLVGSPYIKKMAYLKGYRQAEKDLELTWENMQCIIKHYQDIMSEKSRVFVRVEDYQELLKRFNKERKEK